MTTYELRQIIEGHLEREVEALMKEQQSVSASAWEIKPLVKAGVLNCILDSLIHAVCESDRALDVLEMTALYRWRKTEEAA